MHVSCIYCSKYHFHSGLVLGLNIHIYMQLSLVPRHCPTDKRGEGRGMGNNLITLVFHFHKFFKIVRGGSGCETTYSSGEVQVYLSLNPRFNCQVLWAVEPGNEATLFYTVYS